MTGTCGKKKQRPDIQAKRRRNAAEIIARLKNCAAGVLAKYPVDLAYLHGSVARGCPLPTSDVDIALVLTELPLPYERLMLELDVQASLEDTCGLLDMDVRTINHAPLLIQGRVVREGILLYSQNKDLRVAFEVSVQKRYLDFEPVAKRLQQSFFDRIRREGFIYGQPRHHQIHPE